MSPREIHIGGRVRPIDCSIGVLRRFKRETGEDASKAFGVRGFDIDGLCVLLTHVLRKGGASPDVTSDSVERWLDGDDGHHILHYWGVCAALVAETLKSTQQKPVEESGENPPIPSSP